MLPVDTARRSPKQERVLLHRQRMSDRNHRAASRVSCNGLGIDRHRAWLPYLIAYVLVEMKIAATHGMSIAARYLLKLRYAAKNARMNDGQKCKNDNARMIIMVRSDYAGS
jgi:hypothetical protein